MTHKIKLHTHTVKCGSGVILGMRVTNGYFWDNGIRTHQTEDKTVTFGFGYVYINFFFFFLTLHRQMGSVQIQSKQRYEEERRFIKQIL